MILAHGLSVMASRKYPTSKVLSSSFNSDIRSWNENHRVCLHTGTFTGIETSFPTTMKKGFLSPSGNLFLKISKVLSLSEIYFLTLPLSSDSYNSFILPKKPLSISSTIKVLITFTLVFFRLISLFFLFLSFSCHKGHKYSGTLRSLR